MIRVLMLVASAALLGAFPYMSTTWQRTSAPPRQIIALSLLTLAGLGSGLLLILAAVAGPPNLPAEAIPSAVGRCIDAATQLLSHPVNHWPHILVSIAVLGLVIRGAIAAALTIRESTRVGAVWRSCEVPGDPAGGKGMILVDTPELLACTTGLLRLRIVVSTGVLQALSPLEQRALVAHESAHVRGWHPVLLFLGRVVSRGMSFLPPVRRAADQLLLGLECSADEAAVAEVGDPLVVARALTVVAGGTRSHPIGSLGADGGDVVSRVRRLVSDPPRSRGRATASLVVVVLVVIVLFQGVILAFNPSWSGDPSVRAAELHASCHAPHAASAREP